MSAGPGVSDHLFLPFTGTNSGACPSSPTKKPISILISSAYDLDGSRSVPPVPKRYHLYFDRMNIIPFITVEINEFMGLIRRPEGSVLVFRVILLLPEPQVPVRIIP